METEQTPSRCPSSNNVTTVFYVINVSLRAWCLFKVETRGRELWVRELVGFSSLLSTRVSTALRSQFKPCLFSAFLGLSKSDNFSLVDPLGLPRTRQQLWGGGGSSLAQLKDQLLDGQQPVFLFNFLLRAPQLSHHVSSVR